jgi:calcineurin-like phosphoesterase family protein
MDYVVFYQRVNFQNEKIVLAHTPSQGRTEKWAKTRAGPYV